MPEIDSEYQRRMEDVLALYERPWNEKEPVVCLDEKPVVLRGEVRAPLPAAPGRVLRRDYEYERRGTANVFCAVEPKAGQHFTYPTPNRTAAQFARVVEDLVTHQYPEAETIHFVVDNLNIHGPKALTDTFGEERGRWLWSRLTPHYTPCHASWLNQAEIEISVFSRQCLGKRRTPDLETLTRVARAWNHRANHERWTIDWNFDRQAARKMFAYQNREISRSEH